VAHCFFLQRKKRPGNPGRFFEICAGKSTQPVVTFCTITVIAGLLGAAIRAENCDFFLYHYWLEYRSNFVVASPDLVAQGLGLFGSHPAQILGLIAYHAVTCTGRKSEAVFFGFFDLLRGQMQIPQFLHHIIPPLYYMSS
jgi:hypothetical protein